MDLTDLQIAKNIKQKDSKTYEYIIERYSKQIYYLAYNILHVSCTKEDMEECVADVFWEAWTSIDKFEPEKGAFKTWLFMLTKYKALAYKRKLAKGQVLRVESLPIEDLQIEDATDMESQFISREEQESVMGVIDNFNVVDKELFIRRYFYNEKIKDLMESLGLTRSAIDNRLLRGRKLIKEVLNYE